MGTTLIELPPTEIRISQSVIRLVKDDLTAMDVDAFVHYAREDLDPGSGYGTAIRQRGGVAVKKELEQVGSIGMGEAVITGAGAMKARHIIHACGPKFCEPDLEAKLRLCMRSALRVAGENSLKSVAFPPMGYGFYGVPLDVSLRVMVEEIRRFLEAESSTIGQIVIVVMDKRDFEAGRKILEALRP